MSTAFDCNALGPLSRQLLDFRPEPAVRREPVHGDLRVLHLLSQQPGKTGSGVALLAMVHHGAAAGYRQRAVIGIPGEDPLPDIPALAPEAITAVRFDRPPVPFPIPGMSDIMPYSSTRFSTFTESMLEGYLDAFAQALSAVTRGAAPHLIHSNHLWLLTALARVVFPQTPLCVSSHGTELRQLEKAPQLAAFVRPACAAVDRVFALHAANRADVARAYGISPDRVSIVGAGFRAELFKPGAAATAGRRMELVVAYAGKLSAPKGVPWLIDAMRQVESPPGRRVTLLLAGAAADPGAEAIHRRAEDLDNVVFLGALSQEALAKVLQAADVFVLPSVFGGLPRVGVEALACGCRGVLSVVEGTGQKAEIRDIGAMEFDGQAGRVRLSPRRADGLGGEIHPDGLPAAPGQGDGVGAGAAAEIEGFSRRGGGQKFHHLGWGDVRVPRGYATPVAPFEF